MKINATIKKILILSCWLLFSGGVLALLVAAIGMKDNKQFAKLEIEIIGADNDAFVDKKDIKSIIEVALPGKLEGKAVKHFNLQAIEANLERNVWINDASVFFDNNQVLHVEVTERVPVARVFTTTGYSFYIDSSGYTLPLSNKLSVRVPVFTGVAAIGVKPTAADNAAMRSIKTMSKYISSNPFWMAQVAQIDMVENNKMEIVPTIGNAIIKFGTADSCAQKFENLFAFYKQVLANKGFNKYSSINAEYTRQIVATKKGEAMQIDSTMAIINVRRMMEAAAKKQSDTLGKPMLQVDPDSKVIDDGQSLGMVQDSVVETKIDTTTKPKVVVKPVVVKPVKKPNLNNRR